MAKKSKIAKLAHQEALVKKYAAKRQALKAAGNYIALSKLPRNSSPVRLHNRDQYDGRPHAYLCYFGMSRLTFRRLAHEGKLPGVRTASWSLTVKRLFLLGRAFFAGPDYQGIMKPGICWERR